MALHRPQLGLVVAQLGGQHVQLPLLQHAPQLVAPGPQVGHQRAVAAVRGLHLGQLLLHPIQFTAQLGGHIGDQLLGVELLPQQPAAPHRRDQVLQLGPLLQQLLLAALQAGALLIDLPRLAGRIEKTVGLAEGRQLRVDAVDAALQLRGLLVEKRQALLQPFLALAQGIGEVFPRQGLEHLQPLHGIRPLQAHHEHAGIVLI